MSKTGENEGRFAEEVRSAAHGNPNVDMDLVRECQEITEMLDSLPQAPESKPKTVKPPRLQPIPLGMFSR